MSLTLLLLLAAFGQVAADASPSIPGADPTYRASVHAVNDNRVYSQAEGLLTVLNVREGSRVKKDDILATVDDRRAKAAVDVAQYSYVAADERAKDTIEYDYAVLAAAVAEKAYQMALEAKSRVQTVISEIELEKLKLEWDRGELQGLKAKKDQRLARLDADVKNAELEANRDELDRRTIRAPFDGEVQELLIHESEWVNPGDPILQLVQFDVMWVECYVSADKYDPADLQGRPVTVLVELARGRQAKVAGRVVHVSNMLLESADAENSDGERYGAEFLIRAEVQNRREGDFWLVRPGTPAWLTIHVNQPPVAAAEAAAQASVEQ